MGSPSRSLATSALQHHHRVASGGAIERGRPDGVFTQAGLGELDYVLVAIFSRIEAE
jgi:hypothetical protein